MENASESEIDEDDESTSDDSFVLYQVKAVINQAKKIWCRMHWGKKNFVNL